MAVKQLLLAATLVSAACGSNPQAVREELLNELQPVSLKNCTLQRFGSAHDGGYVMCGNLMQGAEALYSYGIDKEDNWGCELSHTLQLPVHQYDCFTPHRPACADGAAIFHDECVSPQRYALGGNLFDSLPNQIAKNGDASKRLIVKIDIEGAEWASLMATPDDVLARIDQMPMELHGTDDQRFLAVVRKLKQHFHLANLHFNNFSCSPGAAPFPAEAYQVLWVNKRLADVDPSGPVPTAMGAVNAPDAPGLPDCQLPANR